MTAAGHDWIAAQLLEHRAWLRALARSLAGAAAAEDVVQDVCVAALEREPSPSRPLKPWLGAVARRLAALRRRGEGRRRVREAHAARPERLPATHELIERVDAEERLVRELVALEEPFRTTLLLRFFEGLSAAEIARRAGVPEGTVRWRTKRGLDELRERLERAYGGREAFALALVELGRPAEDVGTGIVMSLGGALMAGKWLVGGAAAAAAALVAVAYLRGRGPGDEVVQDAAVASSPVLAASSDTPERLVRDAGEPAESGADRVPLEARPAPAAPVARVRILESDGSPNADKLVVLLPAVGEDLASRRTDAGGWLELPARATPSEVVIERANAFAHRCVVERTAGERELVLPEGEVLEGRVVVRNGPPPRPVAFEVFPANDVGVWVELGGAAPERLLQVEFLTAKCDAEGRFLLRGLRPEQGYNLRFPSGYAWAGSLSVADPHLSLVFHVERPASGLVLEVERFPSVHGRLLLPDGTPTNGALEGVVTWANGTGFHTGARAGDDGYFELFLERPWRRLELSYYGTPGERGRAVATFDPVQAGPDGDLGDLGLAVGRDLVLRVVDGEGQPVQGARCRPEGGPTDERGECRLQQVTTQTLRVAARGHHETTVSVPAQGSSLEVVLLRGPELALSVRTTDGGAPGEVSVVLEGPQAFFDGEDGLGASTILSADRPGRLWSWGGRPFVARYATDADGRLRMDSLRPGVPLTLRVIVPGGLAHEERVPALGAEEWRELSIRLDGRARCARARIVDERGAPVVGASVALPAQSSGGGTHYTSARTDGDGRFEFLWLPSPGATLSISKAGFQMLRCAAEDFERGEPTLVLRRGLELTLTVVDELGALQPGGRLWVHGLDGQALPGLDTDRRAAGPGRWKLTGLGEEELELELWIGGATYRRRVQPGMEVELRVPVMGAVELGWDVGAAPELDWLHLELRASERSRLRASFHATPAGRHRFEPVVPGRYEAVLVVDEEDGELVLARAEVEVRPGETASVDL